MTTDQHTQPQIMAAAVPPSPWPFVGSFMTLIMIVGFLGWHYATGAGPWVFLLGVAGMVFTLVGWGRDFLLESHKGENVSPIVQLNLRYGVAILILAEVVFLFALGWAFLSSALFTGGGETLVLKDGTDILNATGQPITLLNDAKTIALGGQWPPKGVELVSPWQLPLVQTMVLLLSGTTMAWARQAVMLKNQGGVIWGIVTTIGLGGFFLLLQGAQLYVIAMEDMFRFADGGIYGAFFFMLTAMVGGHILIAMGVLAVALFRVTEIKNVLEVPFSFQAANWYWRLGIMLWLVLCLALYLPGQFGT